MTAREVGPGNASVAASPLCGVRQSRTVRLARRGGAGDADADPAATPFVVLHEGQGARILLGEIAGGDGPPVARFAWKLRRDARPRGGDAGAGAPTNRDVDAAWARERSEIARVRSPHVVAPFPVPAGLEHGPPLWYCRRVERFFHPVSPATGERLGVCRDDAALTAAGLGAYAPSSTRYVWAAGSTPATFYRQGATTDVEWLPSGAQVRSERQLVRDWTGLVQAAAGDPAAARALGELPCLDCAHRAECHPRGAAGQAAPAERELLAVSFHDVEALALELHDFDFAEASALLGGAMLPELLVARGVARAQALAAPVAQRLGDGAQWLFAGEPQRWVLEVLRQKLRLFLDVCAGVAAVHATGRPHLALAPAHVLVTCGLAPGAPARWQLRAALADLGSALPVARPAGAGAGAGDGSASAWLEPGADMREDARARAFLAPALLARDGQTMTLPVACWQTGSPDGLVRFVVQAQGPGVPRSFRAGDMVLVQPSTGGPTLVARLDEVRARGLLASALVPGDDPCIGWDGRQFEARLSFHRRLGPAADLHGLGVLLLQALLVDDRQGIDDVADAMARCLRRLEDEPTGVRVEERSAAARLQQLLSAKEQRGRFDPHHLLFREADRDALSKSLPHDRAPIEPALWARVLTAAGRAMAATAPLAFATSLAEHAATPLAQLVESIEVVLARLEVELFHAARRDAAVATACAEFAESARTPDDGRERPGVVRDGFRLRLQRDGEQQTQELRFEVDRVTIGRREGENLLRLNDPMVSSLHAVIESSPDGWVVLDRNSTNGTEVDGIRLPVEVPQPLQDGSVVVIRPFTLTFHALAPAADATLVRAALTPAIALDRLHDTFAREPRANSVKLHEALLACLRDLAREWSPADVLAALPEAHGAGPGTEVVGPTSLDGACARALQQLSRSLLGPGEFTTAEQVQVFAGKVGRFVDTTAHWIERMLELRKALGKHLDLGIASTGAGRPSARTASEIRALVAGWNHDAPTAEPAAWYVAKFYDDVVTTVVGLLQGNQQIRKAVRERLEPARLVEAAGREAKLRLLVQATAGSALWKLYEQTFREVTGGEEREAELEQLLRRAVAEQMPRV